MIFLANGKKRWQVKLSSLSKILLYTAGITIRTFLIVFLLLFVLLVYGLLYPSISLSNGLSLEVTIWHEGKYEGRSPLLFAIYDGFDKVVPAQPQQIGWSDQAVYGLRRDGAYGPKEYFLYALKERRYHHFDTAAQLDSYMATQGMPIFSNAEKYSTIQMMTELEFRQFLRKQQKIR